MNKFILLITIVASVVGIQRAKAETDLLPEDRYWNYELHGRKGFCTDVTIDETLSGCHFEGSETIGEHTYKIFKDGDGNNLGLLRQEGKKIYRYVDEQMREGKLASPEGEYITFPEEILIYDFEQKERRTARYVFMDYTCWGKIYSHFYLQISRRLLNLDTIEVDKCACKRQFLSCESEYFSYYDPKIAIEGIGCIYGLFSAPSMYIMGLTNGSHYAPWKIVDVRDSEGNVIFRYDDFFLPDNGVAGIPPKFSEDWIWEYYTRYSESEHGMTRMKFDGTAEIGGKTYKCFRTISDIRWNGVEKNDHTWKKVTDLRVCEASADVTYLRLEDRCVWRLFEAGTEFEKGSVKEDVPFEGVLTEPTEFCLFNQIPIWGEKKMWLEKTGPHKWEWKNYHLSGCTLAEIESIPYDRLYMGCDFSWVNNFGPDSGGTLSEPIKDINFYGSSEPVGIILNALYDSEGNLIYKRVGKTTPELSGVGYLQDDTDAQPEYFTLDGLRVAAPRSGQLLIRRQGANVGKVLIP